MLTRLFPILNDTDFVNSRISPPILIEPGTSSRVYKEAFETNFLTFGKYDLFKLCLPDTFTKAGTDYIDPSGVRLTKILVEITNLMGGSDLIEISKRIKFGGTGLCTEIKGHSYALGGHALSYPYVVKPIFPPVIENIKLDMNIDSRTNVLEIKEVENTDFKVLGFLFEIPMIDGSVDLEHSDLVQLLK